MSKTDSIKISLAFEHGKDKVVTGTLSGLEAGCLWVRGARGGQKSLVQNKNTHQWYLDGTKVEVYVAL